MVQTLDLKLPIKNDCESRVASSQDEVWAIDVKSRVTQCLDLLSSGARYHQPCRVKFSAVKKLNLATEVEDIQTLKGIVFSIWHVSG